MSEQRCPVRIALDLTLPRRTLDRCQRFRPKFYDANQRRWLEENVPESLTVFRLPAAHRQRLRTTNMLERLNRELKRRTRVATLFPNDASLLRLVTAILVEVSEEWETGKRYVTFETK